MNRAVTAAVLVGVLLIVAGAIGAQDNGQHPVAEFVETTFDFGEVFEQAEYRHVFVVRNRGKADLLIEDVKPG
ncbi:MAG: DUF1573 domain-containing protein [Candidatus Krumholzibacteria bacterium]|nr:DUF1573 domain-containing protein [Candidatus Krumholzibacteria bacterium]MDH4337896.1 DUF1573 domain-containing protein [Candidatus Krumholzibacteria bacterium]MDH5270219.1 DUF1573 domain-containing protein [Candidatus Krumholzibacteria bacterium]